MRKWASFAGRDITPTSPAMLKDTRAVEVLSAHPRGCAVLSVLLAVLGLLFLTGWVPKSPNRLYFQGHEWLMATLCFVLTGFFVYCAVVGQRRKNK